MEDKTPKRPFDTNVDEYSTTPIKCRCGGQPSHPISVINCRDRWVIACQIPRCHARVEGQGRKAIIQSWNRLSLHLFR